MFNYQLFKHVLLTFIGQQCFQIYIFISNTSQTTDLVPTTREEYFPLQHIHDFLLEELPIELDFPFLSMR
jgi:hypothetical protein